jgi:hypothetical protein
MRRARIMAPARTLFFAVLVVLSPLVPARAGNPALSPTAPDAARTVILARGLDADQTLILSSALAAADHPGVLLLDTPGARVANRRFIDEFKPAAVVTIGPPAAGDEPFPESIWQGLFPNANRIVVVNTSSRRLQLQAAALAGAARAPLFVCRGPDGAGRLAFWSGRDGVREVLSVGDPTLFVSSFGLVGIRGLSDEEAVRLATNKFQATRGLVNTIIVANPKDA